MPEFRQNLATREWVIIAHERRLRPEDFKPPLRGPREPIPHRRADCPFCPGNESETPPEILRRPGPEGWSLRVVPNKYAALDGNDEPRRRHQGRFRRAGGYGVAEVIIESPRHDLFAAAMHDEEITRVVEAYIERAAAVERISGINLVTLFRNFGPLAGTSLEHPHSQLIATPIVPPHVRDPLQKALDYYDNEGTCVFCDILAEELAQEARIIEANEHFVAFCPFASRSPYEVRIYPRRHNASLTMVRSGEARAFARILRRTLARLRTCLAAPNYNYLVRSAPVGDEDARHYHWYTLIIPKVTTPAGFEIGTGIYINVVPPEDAAAHLRSCDPEECRAHREPAAAGDGGER
ncbi:MAG: DUF4921 family protein [Candidatus Eisenbacteria bacterium]|nr:DUF4921 family protein [Candidatus Eisenbacteria bacterium]